MLSFWYADLQRVWRQQKRCCIADRRARWRWRKAVLVTMSIMLSIQAVAPQHLLQLSISMEVEDCFDSVALFAIPITWRCIIS